MGSRNGIYINSPDDNLRWLLRRAALERRVTVQALIVRILTDWLDNDASSGQANADGARS